MIPVNASYRLDSKNYVTAHITEVRMIELFNPNNPVKYSTTYSCLNDTDKTRIRNYAQDKILTEFLQNEQFGLFNEEILYQDDKSTSYKLSFTAPLNKLIKLI
jgi:hypothetical protein